MTKKPRRLSYTRSKDNQGKLGKSTEYWQALRAAKEAEEQRQAEALQREGVIKLKGENHE